MWNLEEIKSSISHLSGCPIVDEFISLHLVVKDDLSNLSLCRSVKRIAMFLCLSLSSA